MSVEPGRGLKVLAVSLRYPPYVGGGYELVTRDTIEELRRRGHRVDVLSAHGRALEDVEGVLPWLAPGLDGEVDLFQRSFAASNVERFRLHFFRFANYRATLRAIRRLEPDVLLFFNLGMVSLAPLLAARHAGVSTFGFLGDTWPANHWVQSWRENSSSAANKPTGLELLTRMWRGFRSLVGLGPALVPSAFLRRRLEEEGLAGEDLEVVPHGLPPDLEERARPPVRRDAGAPLRVACTSSLWSGKGQAVLLRALVGARAQGADVTVQLAYAGSDPTYLAELRALAADPLLEGAVEFLGTLAREALGELLAGAHVLALPSLWGEPFGLATLEGMAYGLAVVVSDAGASPEIVLDGESGVVTPAGDAEALAEALVRLAGDEELRLGLAERGLERLQSEFSHAGFVDGIERGIRRAAGESSARAEA